MYAVNKMVIINKMVIVVSFICIGWCNIINFYNVICVIKGNKFYIFLGGDLINL